MSPRLALHPGPGVRWGCLPLPPPREGWPESGASRRAMTTRKYARVRERERERESERVSE